MLDNIYQSDKFKHIFLDFETCNLNIGSPTNYPWQLAFIVCEGDKILKEYEYYLKWDNLPISEGAARVTHFNREKYERLAVDPFPILDEVEQYIYDEKYHVCGHNILNFDIYLHKIFRHHAGKKPDWSYVPRIVDTDCLLRGLKTGTLRNPDESLISYQYRVGCIIRKGLKTNLTEMGKEHQITDINYDILHESALEDIKLNKKVFDKIKWQIN